MKESSEAVEILLIEDNPGDVRLTREALRDGRVCNELLVHSDGDEALAMLRDRVKRGQARPGLILLDLNLPGRNGFQILDDLKSSETLRLIPVIVLTSSAAERDVIASYEKRANAYMAKPIDIDEFLTSIRTLGDFWLSVVKLPK